MKSYWHLVSHWHLALCWELALHWSLALHWVLPLHRHLALHGVLTLHWVLTLHLRSHIWIASSHLLHLSRSLVHMCRVDVVNYLLRGISRFNFWSLFLSKLVLDALLELFEKENESTNKNTEENHSNNEADKIIRWRGRIVSFLTHGYIGLADLCTIKLVVIQESAFYGGLWSVCEPKFWILVTQEFVNIDKIIVVWSETK